MSQFKQVPAYGRLMQLAQKPYDLSQDGALSSARIHKFFRKGCGFHYFFSAERIDDAVLGALLDLAEEREALKQMREMQDGQIVNKVNNCASEERAALHTAMRDLFEDPNTNPEALHAAELSRKENLKLKQFCEEIDQEGNWTDLISIGIGGSELGPKALYIAMEAFRKQGRRVHFVSNVDPDEVAATVAGCDLRNTLTVVVSKSGTTLETLTNEALVRAEYERQGLDSTKHLISVTGDGSPMQDPAKYRASFLMWDFVGGRYSATSMVGGVMLSWALGFDHWMELLKGAHLMDRHAYTAAADQNLPLLAALIGIWNRNFLGHDTVAILPYSRALARFSAHLEQLDMESNGKHIEKSSGKAVDFETGPIIWGEPGTNGQHSFYQMLHQGTTVVPMEFIGFRRSQYQKDLIVQGTSSQEKLISNMLAQVIAFAQGQKSDNANKQCLGNRPSSLLVAESLTPHSLGALLAFYEAKVDFQGFIWGINSFDQEGVQLGKRLALSILEFFSEKRGGSTAKPFPAAQTILEILGLVD